MCDMVEKNFNIYCSEASSQNHYINCLTSTKIQDSVQNSVAIYKIINQFKLHLQAFKIKYYTILNDQADDIKRGEKYSFLKPEQVKCCTGTAVVHVMANIASNKQLFCMGEQVTISEEAIETLRASGVHNFGGMSSTINFRSLNIHITTLENGTSPNQIDFKKLLEDLKWYQKHLQSTIMIEGEFLIRLKNFNELLTKFSEEDNWLGRLHATISYFLDLIDNGAKIRFSQLSLYHAEMLNKDCTDSDEEKMREKYQYNGSNAIDLSYDLNTLNNRQHITCHCEGHCVHVAKFLYICDICNERFVGPKSIDAHLKKHWQNPKENSNIKIHQCEHCRKKFTSRQSLVRHIKSHKFDEFKCTICARKFIFRTNYDKHMKDHGDGKLFQCEKCNSWCKDLALHVTHCGKSNEERQKFVCKVCSKVFLWTTNLTRHEKLHK